jgi:hypothetical protein
MGWFKAVDYICALDGLNQLNDCACSVEVKSLQECVKRKEGINVFRKV